MRRTTSIGLALSVLAALTLVSQSVASGAGTAKRTKASRQLVKFDSCRAFNGYAKRHALRRVTSSGLTGGLLVRGVGEATDDLGSYLGSGGDPAPAPEAATAADSKGVPGQDFSTTNVQEAGVDEADIVKTNGRHLFTVVGGQLHVIDARAALPKLLGSTELPSGWQHELFLRGSRVIVLTRSSQAFPDVPEPADVRYSFAGLTTVTSISVQKPAAPRLIESYSIEGSYLSARLSGDALRIVTTTPSPIGLEFVFPLDSSAATETEALKTNRAEISTARARDWLPRSTHTDHRTTKSAEGRAVPCRRIRRPANFAGLGTVTILTFDLARGLKPVDRDAVMTSGDTVYASTRNLYVTTQRWFDRNDVDQADDFSGAKTLIHRFSTVAPRSTVYRGAGRVRGFVLNQFALSEHEGHLRVATTDIPSWFSEGESESFVTTMKLERGAMPRTGRVGGIGRGERIFAVRFVGDRGYVVTFRRIDPLYTLDLADPARPAVRGELKIVGFSSYLHPISDTQIIGVGQDATAAGSIIGTQVSLFDVSNPAAPKRVDSKTIAGGFSDAEFDHRAFLWWAPERLAILPVQAFEYTDSGLSNWFVGAAGFTVDGTSVEDAGRVTHPTPGPKAAPEPWRAAIRRAVVVGKRLFTVGDNGVGVADLQTLARTGWVPLPVFAGEGPVIAPPFDSIG